MMSCELKPLAFALLVGVTASTAVVGCSRKGSAHSLPGDLARRAESVVNLLNDEKYAEVSTLLHYPPTYSRQQKAADEAAVAEGLKLLRERLGPLINPRLLSGVGVCYELTAGGGDIDYWTSVSPLHTLDFVHAGTFQEFGKGFIVIRFAEISNNWEIQSILFDLDPSVDDARNTAIDLMTGLLEGQARRSGQPNPSNLRELIQTQVPHLPAGKSSKSSISD